MQKPGPVAAGGFYLTNGLPDEYYALTGGELSLTIERGGGINTLGVLDILEHGGKCYPDRDMTPPVIQREGNKCGKRPLYGPGLQFISTNLLPDGRPGRNLFHVPDVLELYPFGFRSESTRFGQRTAYDLCIEGRSVFFRFENAFPTRDQLVVCLNKGHLAPGRMSSMKNQIVSAYGEWTRPEMGLPAPDPRQPFPDGGPVSLTWEHIGLDADTGAFLLEGGMTFAYGATPLVVALLATRPFSLRETSQRYLLSAPWDKETANDEVRLALVLAGSRAEALERAQALLAQGTAQMTAKMARAVTYAAAAPRLEIESLPAAAEFARTIPAFEEAMLLAETPTEACLRAAAHKFGFFAMWDQIYPVKQFLAMGDLERARKLTRYMLDYPSVEAAYWVTVQSILTVEEITAFTGDTAFLQETYPALQRFFHLMAEHADAETGLLALPCSMGVDDPREIGIDGLVFPACMGGWWHGACRAMENAAIRLGDAETERTAHALAAKVEKHYLPVFYDPARGYLHAVTDPATHRGTGVYQNVSTAAMDYPFGDYLLHTHMRELAEYQAYALYHPAGRSAVAFDDEADEMWKNVLMFQHLAHEAKIARAGGMAEEALRITGTYMDIFARTKVGIETHNITTCEGDIAQRANWQAFGARAAYGALLEGVLGLQWDMGGLYYAPGEVSGRMRIAGFRFRQTVWDVEVTGNGGFVGRVEIDGQPILGTLKVPGEVLVHAGAHTLHITRSFQPFDRPTLLQAIGAEVVQVESTPHRLAFHLSERVHTALKIYAPSALRLTIAGAEVAYEWDERTHTLWYDGVLLPEDEVVVE